ncbi:MAG: beta-ketoacyl synthase chain length factor, partial [Syntrophaceae bacterium]|nr:beta-ketoacyl synthase chain length factor [Syntrophaceae bacterium]
DEILDRDEQQLTPTHFMQSSYNAMAGLLAISLKCTGYNNNFVSRGFAFETALHDAVLYLREKENESILLGAFDETSPQQYAEYVRMGYFKPGHIDHLNLFASNTSGTLQGEGVTFFLLSSLPCPNSLCRLRDFRMVRPSDDEVLRGELDVFLSANNLMPQDVDIVINGISGDAVRDRRNMALKEWFFPGTTEARFKHLTGEYTTASAFGMWLGAKILKTQTLPEAVLSGPASFNGSVKTILFCNHFLGKYYSFFLLTRE